MSNSPPPRRPPFCKTRNCEAAANGPRGFCTVHYRRFIRDGGLGTSCALPHCDGGSWAKGLCLPHSRRAARYGLSIADLVLVDARTFCDLCSSNPPEVVDHDHATGAVRGVLCRSCNTALGHFFDSIPRLVGAIHYLSSPPGA